MATIFISHSSHDNGFVEELASDLALLGHKPWTDDLRILPGDKIISSIENGLAQSRYCLVVLSKSGLLSRWVDTEWKEKYWESVTNQKIKIIPILREPIEVPLFLRGLRYADFARSYAVGFSHLGLALSSAESRMPNILDIDLLHSLEHAAKTHHEDQVRLACAHTVWSFRPDRAKPILEDALHDLRDIVRVHAKLLLDEFY
jgi:hypothetical protein